jgi:cytoskeleton protein RodZ
MNDNNDISNAKTVSYPGNIFENLKKQRESRDLSLHDIFATTRISIINLTALENGDFKNLPPPIYTRSFISKYTRTIGCDEKELLDAYESHLAAKSGPVKTPEVQKPWPEDSRRYWLLYGSLSIVIAAGLIVLALFLYDHDKPTAPALQTVSEQVAPSVANKPEAPATVSLTETAADLPPAKVVQPSPDQGLKNLYRLVIEARELTWIRIVKDKKDISEILFRPGEKIEREAAESFFLDIGNAGGVDISFQGRPLGALGNHGEVIHIRLPKEEREGE